MKIDELIKRITDAMLESSDQAKQIAGEHVKTLPFAIVENTFDVDLCYTPSPETGLINRADYGYTPTGGKPQIYEIVIRYIIKEKKPSSSPKTENISSSAASSLFQREKSTKTEEENSKPNRLTPHRIYAFSVHDYNHFACAHSQGFSVL